MKEIKKLNFGCGNEIIKGYVNMDILKLPGVNVVHNFNKFPYPFKDNEFDEIYTSHVLEHLDDLIKVMVELKRICKPGAKIKIRVPHFSCGVSYRDPTHKRLFSYFTFDYFTEKCFYDLPNFKIKNRRLNFTRWAFPFLKDKAKDYGLFLKEKGISEIPVSLADKSYVDKQEKPFATQLWLRRLGGGGSGLDGNGGGYGDNLACDGTVRGVRCGQASGEDDGTMSISGGGG